MKNYKVSPFTIDITPPVGHPLAFCINENIDSNIFIRGIWTNNQLSITRNWSENKRNNKKTFNPTISNYFTGNNIHAHF